MGLEGQLGVETVLRPSEVGDDKDTYGLPNARWTCRWSVWTLQVGRPVVRPPKIPGQAKDEFILYYAPSHALLAWSIQRELRTREVTSLKVKSKVKVPYRLERKENRNWSSEDLGSTSFNEFIYDFGQ